MRHEHRTEQPGRRRHRRRVQPRHRQPLQHAPTRHLGHEEQRRHTHGQNAHEHLEKSLQPPQPKLLEKEQNVGADGTHEHALVQLDRAPREQEHRQRRPNHLLNVAPDDRQLRHQPQQNPHRPRPVHVPAVLREVPRRGHAQLGSQRLQHPAQHRRVQEHPQQLVARAHPGLQVRLQVAGIDIGDAHEKPGTDVLQKVPPRAPSGATASPTR